MMIPAHPFNYPYDGRFNPERTALLIIDMQRDFLDGDGYLAGKGYDPAPLRAIIPNVRRLADEGRRAGCRVVWTRQGHRADLADMTDYDRWRAERSSVLRGGVVHACRRGRPGFEIVPSLEVHEADIVVDKTANGAFYQTDLDLILRSQQITHLMFAGCTTDVCVHTTLREASDRKYQCLLIKDACASGDLYAHEAAVHMVTVEDGVFGVVARTEDVLSALDAPSPSSTPALG